MIETTRHDVWAAGDNYDRYMGRWSRRIAPLFLDWLQPAAGLDWLDVGCGTGALSGAILERCQPKSLLAIDASSGFIETAYSKFADPRVTFDVGDAQALDAGDHSRDVIVSGLMLNFVPDRMKALREMRRVVRPGGQVAFYVWDYPGGGIEFMRAFWNAAVELDPAASGLTEGSRFPFCTRETLAAEVQEAGLLSVETSAIEAATTFADFNDYWQPFSLGTGPAPGYCASLEPAARERLRQKLDADLPREADGSIRLHARAWAVRARAD